MQTGGRIFGFSMVNVQDRTSGRRACPSHLPQAQLMYTHGQQPHHTGGVANALSVLTLGQAKLLIQHGGSVQDEDRGLDQVPQREPHGARAVRVSRSTHRTTCKNSLACLEGQGSTLVGPSSWHSSALRPRQCSWRATTCGRVALHRARGVNALMLVNTNMILNWFLSRAPRGFLLNCAGAVVVQWLAFGSKLRYSHHTPVHWWHSCNRLRSKA